MTPLDPHLYTYAGYTPLAPSIHFCGPLSHSILPPPALFPGLVLFILTLLLYVEPPGHHSKLRASTLWTLWAHACMTRWGKKPGKDGRGKREILTGSRILSFLFPRTWQSQLPREQQVLFYLGPNTFTNMSALR